MKTITRGTVTVSTADAHPPITITMSYEAAVRVRELVGREPMNGPTQPLYDALKDFGI